MATYYQIGSKGNEVKTLQDQLRAAGYDPGISDGIYGKNTTSAVTEYQKAKGLTVDGIAGVQTLGSLNTPIIPSQQPQPVQTVQPVQPAAKQPAQPEPVYTSPYAKQEQQALADYQTWASQPYVSQYAPQLEAKINEVLSRQFNYDPANDAQAQLAIKEMTRNVLETMNSRGILNSTLSRDGVTQGVADLLPQYQQMARQAFQDEGQMLMSQVDMLLGVDETQYGRYQDEGKKYADVLGVVMDMSNDDYQKWTDAYERRYRTERDKITDAQTKAETERQKIKDAWDRTSELGYVDNQSSIALGVSAGTLSKEAREAKIQREQELADAKTAYSRQLGLINAQYEKEKKVSALKEKVSDPASMGTPEQASRYYTLLQAYTGNGSGLISKSIQSDPSKALSLLMRNKANIISEIGSGLYEQLTQDVQTMQKNSKLNTATTSTVDDYAAVINKAYITKNDDDEVIIDAEGIKSYLDNMILSGVDDTIVDSLAVRYGIQ